MSDRDSIASPNDPRINVQPIELLANNVDFIGLSVNKLFNAQASAQSVNSCDDLLNALSTAETAVRKLRVRLVQGELK